MKIRPVLIFCLTLLILSFFTQCREKQESNQTESVSIIDPILEVNPQDFFLSPLDKKLIPPVPSEIYIKKYREAQQNYVKDSTALENIIWLGRRTAYLGKYREAIGIYTKGIKLYPDEPRLYRHRGHRYISIRKFDLAIKDLEIAAQLIQDQDNKIEVDGLPNAQNIPVSTLHGNIWYHLGLAYYLTFEYEQAYNAYKKGRESGNNDDNIVSTTHWLYMIQRRMGNEELARDQLEPIHNSMEVIENHSYYKLCKFYKGLISKDSLTNQPGNPSGDAMMYGIANWDFYNGDKVSAKKAFKNILNGSSWTSFGYIAAEQDYLKFYQ